MTYGRNHPEFLAEIVKGYVRDGVESRPVAAMAEVREVDGDTRRATIELLRNRNEKSDNVPICVPFATGESGDVLPIQPGVRGIVLFLDHPVTEQLEEDGTTSDGTGMDIEDAVFLPACFTTDGEGAPFHYTGDRVWEHPSGSRISMQDDDAIVRIDHPNGASIVVGGRVEEEDEDNVLPDSFFELDQGEFSDERERELLDPSGDNRSYPPENEGEGYTRFEYVTGTQITVSERGVSMGNDGTGIADELYSGQPNDPERRELDGHHQHFHLLDHGGGEHSLVGPQLSFREFLAWMTDEERQSKLRNADYYADARTYAENYLAWLEDEVGHDLDPTDPDDWPDEEPMPDPDERNQFDPDT